MALPKGLDSLMSHGLQERQEAPIMDKAANSGGVKQNRKYQQRQCLLPRGSPGLPDALPAQGRDFFPHLPAGGNELRADKAPGPGL